MRLCEVDTDFIRNFIISDENSIFGAFTEEESIETTDSDIIFTTERVSNYVFYVFLSNGYMI